MFDTMTLTKILGAVCGTFLIFLLGNWAAESIYHVGPEGHGDGEEVAQAYVIDTGVDESAGGDEPEVDFAALVAAADPADGESVFKKCAACHKLDGSNGTGPHLDGVVGRDIGSVAGYAYSGILEELPGNWDANELNHFLESPKGFAPGTKMTFNGLRKVEDRAELVAYLQSIGG